MANDEERKKNLISSLIRPVPDFPKPGILFRDICPLLKNPEAFSAAIDLIVNKITTLYKQVDVIVGLDARGFLFGPGVAMKIGAAFVPVRKQGKLPGQTIPLESEKEYGKDVLEIQHDAITDGQKVVIFDDLVATGGTVNTVIAVTRKASGGTVLVNVI